MSENNPEDVDLDLLDEVEQVDEIPEFDPEAPADSAIDPETIAHLDPDDEVPASGQLPPDPTVPGAPR